MRLAAIAPAGRDSPFEPLRSLAGASGQRRKPALTQSGRTRFPLQHVRFQPRLLSRGCSPAKKHLATVRLAFCFAAAVNAIMLSGSRAWSSDQQKIKCLKVPIKERLLGPQDERATGQGHSHKKFGRSHFDRLTQGETKRESDAPKTRQMSIRQPIRVDPAPNSRRKKIRAGAAPDADAQESRLDALLAAQLY